jgi:outer membrane protein assembly factor BamB
LNDELREGVYFPQHGSPQSAAILATTRIRELLDKHGASAFADFEKQAKDTHARARGSIAGLENLIRQYPNASIVPLALAEVAKLQEKAGRFGAAAQSYRQLFRLKDDPVPALLRLAHAYEKQHCDAAAKATWLVLARKHGDKMVKGRPVREIAGERLRKIAHQDHAINTEAWSWPMAQTWSGPAGELLIPKRNALAPMPQIVFLAAAQRLSAHEAADGKERWSRDLPFTPTWLGLHADIVLAAAQQGVAALRLEDGQPIWTFAPRTPDHAFSGFQITTTHLFFFDLEGRLLALELETARVAWSQWAPGASFPPLSGGGFSPHFHAGPDWVAVQSSSGRRLIFDARTGKQLQNSSSSAPWIHDPLPLDEQRLCLVEKGRVLVLETTTWKELWNYSPSWPTSWTGEPLQVACNGKAFLVLIPRNYGFELDRLDPQTGKSVWEQPWLLSRDAVDARTISMNDGCLYYVGDGVLSCRSLADGKRLWQKPLPGKSRRWQTLQQANAVIAFPAEGRQPPWLWLPLGNTLLAVPNVHDVLNRELTVSCHHTRDGRLLRRLDFSAAATRLNVQRFTNGLVIQAGDHACGFAAEKR